MRIVFQKLSNDRHVLKIFRDDGRHEQVECETRSYLMHDLLHYAVEGEAHIDDGFWGSLARGKTLAQLNDLAGERMSTEGLGAVERVVGALSGIAKGMDGAKLFRQISDSFGSAGSSLPAWASEDLALAVQERMRRVVGQWKATRFGEAMVLPWPLRT